MQQLPKDSFKDLEGKLKEFYEIHGVQLLAMEFPASISLLEELKTKLENQIFDAGQYFEVEDNEVSETFTVKSKQDIKAFSKVFLIDHSLSFRFTELHKLFQQKPELIDRVEYMLKYAQKKRKIPGVTIESKQQCSRYEEYDDMQIIDPNQMNPKEDCVALSFYSNLISEIGLVQSFLKKLPALKVIWLNENPISNKSFEELRDLIEKEFPHIEIVNSNFTKNAGSWSFKYITFDQSIPKTEQQQNQLIKHLNLGGRDIFRVDQLSKKLRNEFPKLKSLDIRETKLETLEQTNILFDVLKENNIRYIYCDLDVENIFFELHKNDKLRNITKSLRLINGRDIFHKNYVPADQITVRVQKIIENVFRITGSYRLLSSEKMDEESVWYVMDEFGTFIEHSDLPNVKVMPILYMPSGKIDDQTISYSIIWPLKDLGLGEPLYRDYLLGIPEEKQRSARLSVWFNIPFDKFKQAYKEYKEKLALKTQKIIQYEEKSTNKVPFIKPDEEVKVITDLEQVTIHLKLPNISFTKEVDEANLIFFSAPIHDDLSKFEGKWVNQFPSEIIIVAKDTLAQTVQFSLGEVKWLQETFNLQTQLGLFLGAHKLREEQYKDNTWIIKPPNMARSMDTVVTNNLDVIIRLLETGPKIAQKYIHRPLTLRGKKIDLRYIICLRSLDPLEVYMYEVFWIRTSNIDYTLDVNSFSNYETHFTVMNYGRQLTQIHYYEFIEEFERENKEMKWSEVQEKVKNMVRELFIGIKQVTPQMHSSKSRAIYGMDVMISMPEYQPKLLELTFSPDCNRACKYSPSFYNDLFETLYYGKENPKMIKLL